MTNFDIPSIKQEILSFTNSDVRTMMIQNLCSFSGLLFHMLHSVMHSTICMITRHKNPGIHVFNKLCSSNDSGIYPGLKKETLYLNHGAQHLSLQAKCEENFSCSLAVFSLKEVKRNCHNEHLMCENMELAF